jgi:hypothetical protein
MNARCRNYKDKPLDCSNFASSIASNALVVACGGAERVRQMWNIMRRPIATTIAAIAFGNVGIGSAAAADIPTPPSQVQPPPDYYTSPPAEEGYIYPPPGVYGYPPPPPTSYYEYGAPPVVIVPRPFYLGRRYGTTYGDHPYVQGPYAARGYGRYDPQWGRGHRGW